MKKPCYEGNELRRRKDMRMATQYTTCITYFMKRSPYFSRISTALTTNDIYLSITTTATDSSTKNTVEACSWLFMMLLAYVEYCA